MGGVYKPARMLKNYLKRYPEDRPLFVNGPEFEPEIEAYLKTKYHGDYESYLSHTEDFVKNLVMKELDRGVNPVPRGIQGGYKKLKGERGSVLVPLKSNINKQKSWVEILGEKDRLEGLKKEGRTQWTVKGEYPINTYKNKINPNSIEFDPSEFTDILNSASKMPIKLGKEYRPLSELREYLKKHPNSRPLFINPDFKEGVLPAMSKEFQREVIDWFETELRNSFGME